MVCERKAFMECSLWLLLVGEWLQTDVWLVYIQFVFPASVEIIFSNQRTYNSSRCNRHLPLVFLEMWSVRGRWLDKAHLVSTWDFLDVDQWLLWPVGSMFLPFLLDLFTLCNSLPGDCNAMLLLLLFSVMLWFASALNWTFNRACYIDFDGHCSTGFSKALNGAFTRTSNIAFNMAFNSHVEGIHQDLQ